MKVSRNILDDNDSIYYEKAKGSEISLKLDKNARKERSSDSYSYRSIDQAKMTRNLFIIAVSSKIEIIL